MGNMVVLMSVHSKIILYVEYLINKMWKGIQLLENREIRRIINHGMVWCVIFP